MSIKIFKRTICIPHEIGILLDGPVAGMDIATDRHKKSVNQAVVWKKGIFASFRVAFPNHPHYCQSFSRKEAHIAKQTSTHI
ncbi:MAG: hypothetical protein PVF29_11340 [Desulfobacterales bacterium]|jgi:hypothetical protein